jgi:flagellar protein FliJ
MTTFHFRLATLLRLREATRDERRGALAEAYRVDDVLRQRIEHVARELASLRAQSRQAAARGAVDVDRLLEAQRYELALRAAERQLAEQRASVAEEIERRRRDLAEAGREVRVLEKLREKQQWRHNREEARRETKVLDEVGLRRATWKEAP